MTPSRILPDLQCSLLCQDVRQEINGNLILIGVIAFVRVPQLPITANALCLFNRWTAGVGVFTEVARLIAPDQTTVLAQRQTKFGLDDPGSNVTNVPVFGPVEFKTAGIYYVEVLVDDVMKLRFPLPVVLAPPPPAPGQPG